MKYKKIVSGVMSILLMLSIIMFPNSEKLHALSYSEQLDIGESYIFDFKNNEVIETKVGISTTVDSYGNKFIPFMSQNGKGTDKAEQADIDVDGDGTEETSTLKWTVTGWNSVYIPTDKEGKPFELQPDTKYSVSVKVYVESKSANGQIMVGGGVQNQYNVTNRSSGMIWDVNSYYNNGELSDLRTGSATFTTDDYTVSNGKFTKDGKEYLNYLYLYSNAESFKYDGTNITPTVIYIDSITITKVTSFINVGYEKVFEFDTVKAENAKDAEGNIFTPFMSQSGSGTDSVTQVNLDIDGDGKKETSTLKWSVTGWNSVYIPTDKNGMPFVLEPNTTYAISVKVYVESKSAYGQIMVGGGVQNQYNVTNRSSGMIWDANPYYNNGELSDLRTGSATFTTGDYTVSNGKFTKEGKEYLNYLYLYSNAESFEYDGINTIPTTIYVDSITVKKVSGIVFSPSNEDEKFKSSYASIGDLNNDKNIDSMDLISLRKLMLESSKSFSNTGFFDVNEDEEVDARDIVRMKKVLVGIVGLSNKIYDVDGNFEYALKKWQGIEGYKIVVPSQNDSVKKSAESLQSYYKQKYNVELPIVTDETIVTEKEILVGLTNRKESICDLIESELEVSLKNDKLVFSGGHDVMIDSAIKRFLRLSPTIDTVFLFKSNTDFKSNVLNGYEYVWGDEFEGTELDLSKWSYEKKMGGSTEIEVSYDSDVISVADGKLQLKAIQYENPNIEGTKYKVPYSVATEKHMNFVYGYAEIRAKVPYFKGSWPSFWTQSTGYLSGKRNKDYMVEVDIFEIFGSPNKVVPNLHKWYTKDYDYGLKHLGYSTGAFNTIWGELEANKNIWQWRNFENISYEYHTYGWEWTPTEMSMFVDGKKYMTFDITKSYDLNSDTSGFHDPQFLMFNNHVFTNDSTHIGSLITESLDKLPACYNIDYCRVYQKKNVGELYID